MLLGLRVRVHRLYQRLVLYALHPGFHYRAGQLPSFANHHSRVVHWSVLRDVRPVSVQNRRQIVEQLDRMKCPIELFTNGWLLVLIRLCKLINHVL